MREDPPPRDRAELERRLRHHRIESRKGFGTYVSMQTTRRIAEAQNRMKLGFETRRGDEVG